VRVLIIGYGSIGKRHFEILSCIKSVNFIEIVTKQNIQNSITYESLNVVNELNNYDYFIISSETLKHYEHLKYIIQRVSNKIILVEKPLFDKEYSDLETNGNTIYTAYNLRFHPIVSRLKELLQDEKIYYANIICGQYLPTWRPEQDYTKSYSADRKHGGGVLRDLSHELDYSSWLFGKILKVDSINSKVSDLQISSDDIFTAIMTTKDKVVLNISLDYISKIPIRRLIIHTKETTIEANLIDNTLLSYNSTGEKTVLCNTTSLDRNYTYKEMHTAILENKTRTLSSFKDGLEIVSLISSIKFMEI